MRKLALPEEVLLQIEQPARYIGNEFNSVVKDKEKVALRGAFLFPEFSGGLQTSPPWVDHGGSMRKRDSGDRAPTCP